MPKIWMSVLLLIFLVTKLEAWADNSGGQSYERPSVQRTIIMAVGERPHPDEIYNTNRGRRDNKYHASGGGVGHSGGSGGTSFSQTFYGSSSSQSNQYPSDGGKSHNTIVVGEREDPQFIYYTNRGRTDRNKHSSTHVSFKEAPVYHPPPPPKYEPKPFIYKPVIKYEPVITYEPAPHIPPKHYGPEPKSAPQPEDPKTEPQPPSPEMLVPQPQYVSLPAPQVGYVPKYITMPEYLNMRKFLARPKFHSKPNFLPEPAPKFESQSVLEPPSNHLSQHLSFQPVQAREIQVQSNNNFMAMQYGVPKKHEMPVCPRIEDNFCRTLNMGHYPHPDNKHCYVQCDDYGKSYVRNCPYGTEWKRAPEQPYNMGYCG